MLPRKSYNFNQIVDMINVSLNFGAKQGQIDLSTTKILKIQYSSFDEWSLKTDDTTGNF